MIFHLYHQDIQSTVLVSLLLIGACYDLKCPVRSQRQQRSNNSCNIGEAEYMCLRDVFTFQHIEMCATKRHFQRPGYIIVWSGNIDGQVCESQRYQPIRYFNRDGSDCILEKSVCNEEGQILVENGSPVRDRQCRCDYRRGYAFVFDLPNKCNCIPSIEDCSCYLKHCPKFQVLSPDYQCIWQDEIYESMNCTRLLDCNDDIQEKKKTTSTKCAKTNSAGLFSDTPVNKERNCTVRIVYAIICLVILNGIAVIGLFVFIIHAWFQWKCLVSDNGILPGESNCTKLKSKKLGSQNERNQRNKTFDNNDQSTSPPFLYAIKVTDKRENKNQCCVTLQRLVECDYKEHDVDVFYRNSGKQVLHNDIDEKFEQVVRNFGYRLITECSSCRQKR